MSRSPSSRKKKAYKPGTYWAPKEAYRGTAVVEVLRRTHKMYSLSQLHAGVSNDATNI